MRHLSQKIWSSVDATVTQISPIIEIRQLYGISLILLSSSGSNSGTVKFQLSNDSAGAGTVIGYFNAFGI